jgi:hypothetical protein
VVWYRYDVRTDQYQQIPLPADRRYRSRAIPGLDIEVLDLRDWTEGCKLRVYYRGEELREGEVEEQARKTAERLGELERQARMSAEQQVEQLLARLRQAGLEP